MKKHWAKIVIGLLCLLLFAVGSNYAVMDAKYKVLEETYEQATLKVQTQTDLIVELRQKSIKRNFESLEELKVWVANWEVENKPIVLSIFDYTFVVAGNTKVYSDYWDCDDISEAMQRDALRDGYLMSICVTTVGGRGHAGCLAMTDNAYWFVEPSTGEITSIARRD